VIYGYQIVFLLLNVVHVTHRLVRRYHNLGSGRPTSIRDFRIERTLGQPLRDALKHLGARLKAVVGHRQTHHIADRFNLERDPRVAMGSDLNIDI
jgi:hypothetical protein